MANRLKNRNMQIPNGYRFYIPQANWHSPPWVSFDVLVDKVMAVIRANPFLAQQHGWPVDRKSVEDWVEGYNVTLCERNGWTNYLSDVGENAPKLEPPSPLRPGRYARLAAGAKTLEEWIGEGGISVAQELADRRALTCAGQTEETKCPQNQPGDLESFFTKPASEIIRRWLQNRNEGGYATASDDRINVCDACGCPLKLKVHVPLAKILKHLLPAEKALLDARCWILHESQQPK